MNKEDEFRLFRNELPIEPDSSQHLDFLTREEEKPIVLVIDDDYHVREALNLTLGKIYSIILCANGNEGIENTSQNVFAVLLDIKMEGKNGFQTFIEIKNKNPFVPIIFHSAYQDIKSPLEIMNNYRPFGYVIKGSEGKELLHTLESAVDYYFQINKNIELAKQLQKKNNSLQELQDSLEILVEMRTKELYEALNKISSINTTLHKLSITDGLTGIVNRRHFDILWKQECMHALSNLLPLSIIMIDVDFFKKLNDTYGHPFGDSILKLIAHTLQNSLNNPSNILARYGGEEFVVILPNTEETEAINLAEILRKNIEFLPESALNIAGKITISLGVTTWNSNSTFNPESILDFADNALYEAKRNGRNQVVCASKC